MSKLKNKDHENGGKYQLSSQLNIFYIFKTLNTST